MFAINIPNAFGMVFSPGSFSVGFGEAANDSRAGVEVGGCWGGCWRRHGLWFCDL